MPTADGNQANAAGQKLLGLNGSKSRSTNHLSQTTYLERFQEMQESHRWRIATSHHHEAQQPRISSNSFQSGSEANQAQTPHGVLHWKEAIPEDELKTEVLLAAGDVSDQILSVPFEGNGLAP